MYIDWLGIHIQIFLCHIVTVLSQLDLCTVTLEYLWIFSELDSWWYLFFLAGHLWEKLGLSKNTKNKSCNPTSSQPHWQSKTLFWLSNCNCFVIVLFLWHILCLWHLYSTSYTYILSVPIVNTKTHSHFFIVSGCCYIKQSVFKLRRVIP